MKLQQLELFPTYRGGERPPVGLRVSPGGGRFYLCGPELPKYLKRVAKLRAPKFECEYLTAHSDCRCETAPQSDTSPAAQEEVAQRLRDLGVLCSVEDPGPPQVKGPIRWGEPDQWGVRSSELVMTEAAQGAGFYQLSPHPDGTAGLWYYDAQGGSGPPALTVVDGEVATVICASVKKCERLAERHLELANQETGYRYEDWDRGDGYRVPAGQMRWRGGGRSLPPIPESTFHNVMTFESRANAEKAAKRTQKSAVSPHVAVKAKPVRVYQWDGRVDGRLKAPAFGHIGQKEHGAWALSPDGKALLTRWAKNTDLRWEKTAKARTRIEGDS